MSADELRAFLTHRAVKFEERETQYGIEFRCGAGEVFSVYTYSGKVVTGGKHTPLSDELTSRIS